jgi:ribosome-associated translation inhibitor RaiA
MRAWIEASDDIHAEAMNGTMEAAVARAAAQLAKRLSRVLQRTA